MRSVAKALLGLYMVQILLGALLTLYVFLAMAGPTRALIRLWLRSRFGAPRSLWCRSSSQLVSLATRS